MNDAYDTSSLFMLQLACIIKMIAVYKKHTLRVHLLNTVDIQSQKVQLKQLLSTLRIKATINEVCNYYKLADVNCEKDSNNCLSCIRLRIGLRLTRIYWKLIKMNTYLGKNLHNLK